MKENPGAYPVYSSSAHNNGLMGTYGNYMFDQELITWSIDGGGAVFFRPRHKFSVTNVCGFIICKKQIDTPFLAYQMNNIHSIMGFDYIHKAHPSVIRTLYTLGIPSIAEQKEIGSFFVHIDSTIALCQRKLGLLTQAKKALMQQIFSRKLRFTADDGSAFPDWEEKKLGDIADVFGGGTPSTENPEYWDGDVQWFTPTEVGHSKYVSKSVRSISHLGLDKSSAKLLPKGALLLTSRATVGDISIAANECCTNQGFQSLVVKDGIDNEFIYYAQPLIKRYCLQHAAGSTFIEISGKNLAKMPISIPSLLEQQKIAACLRSADALIDQARAELEQWREVKKSLLQQLFV